METRESIPTVAVALVIITVAMVMYKKVRTGARRRQHKTVARRYRRLLAVSARPHHSSHYTHSTRSISTHTLHMNDAVHGTAASSEAGPTSRRMLSMLQARACARCRQQRHSRWNAAARLSRMLSSIWTTMPRSKHQRHTVAGCRHCCSAA